MVQLSDNNNKNIWQKNIFAKKNDLTHNSLQGDKISMWLCEAKPQEAIVKIGQTLKKRLGIDDKVVSKNFNFVNTSLEASHIIPPWNMQVLLGFECHNDTINKTGSTAKSRYQVVEKYFLSKTFIFDISGLKISPEEEKIELQLYLLLFPGSGPFCPPSPDWSNNW